MNKGVIVGVDGSPGALAAAHYGALTAERYAAPLTLVQVVESVFYRDGPLADGAVMEQLREAARRDVDETVAVIRAAYPAVRVTAQLKEGSPAAVLTAESRRALGTVVGSRGLGGFAGLLLGSVSAQVAAHGHGTVVVVRPGGVPGGPVLIGYDGSAPAEAALNYAIGEALLRKVTLVVTNAYWEKPWGLRPEPVPEPAVTAVRRAQQLIADALELPLEQHPELDVEIRTVHSLNPAHSLIEASAGAGLTVVGCRGRGGFAGLLLGSLSQSLLHHATGPVAVVHAHEH